MATISCKLFSLLCVLHILGIAYQTSAQPGFLYLYCDPGKGNYTTNSTYQNNLNTVLTNLYSNTEIDYGFYNSYSGQNADKVNAIGLCRGDVKPEDCRTCLNDSRVLLPRLCPYQKEASGGYDNCMLRYSNRSIFGIVEISPLFYLSNINKATEPDRFNYQVIISLTKILTEAVASDDSRRKFAAANVSVSSFQYIYGLVQCTPDLSSFDCDDCLVGAISRIPDCCNDKVGGRVIMPSCNIRYENYRFYDPAGIPSPPSQSPTAPPPPSSTNNTSSEESKKGRSTKTTIMIVIPIVVCAVLLSSCCGCYLLRRKARKSNHKKLLKINFGDESNTLESLQYDLATIKAATNNFSQENKIGKGGFGQVYKGILSDGRNIAVKRLSMNSKQGSIEFKNEILLIAKLQHRNLVTLIGFCLEEQEKILIYEYMPNGSLDYFLFATQQQKLSWSERYKIIGGIASGILYLHEYSRLKVIHRDLKPSNVLLDEKMNPKLSDFGMARMVEMDQDRGDTNTIAGTYGYMSPEYAMRGQFSEKSDVFSFGVMILEIITGKRNTNSYELHNNDEGLVSYVWRQWKNQTPLSILDPSMKGNCSEIEVIKCIQIGLLCIQENPNARPTMATIISYLSSQSQELPFPQEPTHFLYNNMNREMVTQEIAGFGQFTNGLTPHSLNEMSISKLYPR